MALCEQPLPASGEYEGLSETGSRAHPYTVVVAESIGPTVPARIYLHLASGGGNRDRFLQAWRPYYANTDVPGLMVVVGTTDRPNSESLLALIDQVSDQFCVSIRIHVMGTSSSASTAVHLACDAADRVASYSSGLGPAFPGEKSLGCVPERPIPLVSFTGDSDRFGDSALVARWAELNGCDPEPATEELGSGVSRIVYVGCDAAVEFFDLEGKGHVRPLHDSLEETHPAGLAATGFCSEYEEVDYLEDAFRFFEENPLP